MKNVQPVAVRLNRTTSDTRPTIDTNSHPNRDDPVVLAWSSWDDRILSLATAA
jgi:hypothetical protein